MQGQWSLGEGYRNQSAEIEICKNTAIEFGLCFCPTPLVMRGDQLSGCELTRAGLNISVERNETKTSQDSFASLSLTLSSTPPLLRDTSPALGIKANQLQPDRL